MEILITKGHFLCKTPLPRGPKSKTEYLIFRSLRIPKEILDNLPATLNADKILDQVLNNCCPPSIAHRLKEHVNCYKIKKHHRRPLIKFLPILYDVEPDWHKHPMVIQGELLKFRNSLLDDMQRESAYGFFQNLKNSFSVLIEHELLPPTTILPDNLKKPTNEYETKLKNPIISETNIYDEKTKKAFISSTEFLNNYGKDVRKNLELLISEARKTVFEGYHDFLSKNELIERSLLDEFISHPDLRVINKGRRGSRKKTLNPFYEKHPLSFQNRLATLDYFFDLVVNKKPLPNVYQLSVHKDLLGYLGLTPTVASAMQIIIVEELGINPYSLYRINITSDGHGHEFVQITDSGSVRLRSVKPRARMVRTSHALGSNTPLSVVKEGDIDAATCLKMALEMTRRTRDVIQSESLWLCLSPQGAFSPSDGTFQNHFNIIRERASTPGRNLTGATLKKVRTSKALLIYLDSNGDSLKSATYLGNQVKTTLSRYIPDYVTELIYRSKIRSFQGVLLFMSVSKEDTPSKALGLSEQDFKDQLKSAFTCPGMGGNLFNELTTKNRDKHTANEVYFCVSVRNVALAIKYVKEGNNEELKRYCRTVLSKISEGPILLKKLLRNAQEELKQLSPHAS